MRDRIRAARATITSAPWRRAPILLLGRPGVLATVAGASAVVAASLAAVPLFLSSVGTASVELQASERCPRDTGATLPFTASPSDVTERSADPFVPVSDRLGPSNRWVRLEVATLAGADPSQETPASLLVRDDALDHVEVLEGTDGPGVWISDRGAELTGLAVGDQASIGEARVPVVGIYRDLGGTSVDDYWCSHADLVLLQARGPDLVLPPPLVIADEQTFATLIREVPAPTAAAGGWEAPLRDDLTVADTEALVDELACGADGQQRSAIEWCANGRPRVPRSSGGFSREPLAARDAGDFVQRYLHSHLPFVTKRSHAIQTSVGGGVWPVAGFAALAGVGLVAAAASLWFDRRRREVTLLTVRGVSPAGLGAKAVLELSLAAAIGVIGGIGLAYLMVIGLGPSSVLEPSALASAAGAGLFALALAAVTVGAVVAWRVRSHEARRQRRMHLGALPWELVLVALTVTSYRRLGDWGIPVGRGAEVSRVDVWGLLFPVLFLVTAVAILSRVLTVALRPVRAASRGWPTPWYLAVRRVARYRVAVIGLVAASAVAAGVLAYAATMNRSLDATLQTKAQTFVGSDLSIRLARDEALPEALVGRATEVHTFGKSSLDLGSRRGVTVIAIDPETFERAAFWDGSFADAPLGDVLDQLAAPSRDGQVPAVVVGMDLPVPTEVSIEDAGTTRFTVAAIEGVEAFPGMKRSEPTVFVAASVLDGRDVDDGLSEVWISGDRDHSLRVLEAESTGFSEGRSRTDVADRSSFLTVSWTFGFMRSLGLAAGFLVLGGVAIYLDARRRDRLLGYTFMRRMGLSARQHRRALVVELSASVLVGCWGGLAIALVAAWFAHQEIDPVPGFPPAPLLRPAVAVVAGLAALSVVIVGVAAVLAQRRIEKDDPVEVLRAGA